MFLHAYCFDTVCYTPVVKLFCEMESAAANVDKYNCFANFFGSEKRLHVICVVNVHRIAKESYHVLFLWRLHTFREGLYRLAKYKIA